METFLEKLRFRQKMQYVYYDVPYWVNKNNFRNKIVPFELNLLTLVVPICALPVECDNRAKCPCMFCPSTWHWAWAGLFRSHSRQCQTLSQPCRVHRDPGFQVQSWWRPPGGHPRCCPPTPPRVRPQRLERLTRHSPHSHWNNLHWAVKRNKNLVIEKWLWDFFSEVYIQIAALVPPS